MRLGPAGLTVVLLCAGRSGARADGQPAMVGAVQPAPVRVRVISAPPPAPAMSPAPAPALVPPVPPTSWASAPPPAAWVRSASASGAFGLAPEPAPVQAVVRADAPQRGPDACLPARRGPVEVRDEWLLSQPRLTLPAASPDPLACGEWRVRLAVNRGNDFGWTQTRAGELPQGGDRRFLVDGEHQTTEIGVRYGLSPRVDVGLRVPVQWRGPGFMDAPIDWFHQTTGFLDNVRSAFRDDQFRVEGRTPDFQAFSWSDQQGSGLGRIEVSSHYAFATPPGGRGLAAALIGRVALPTGTGPFTSNGVDAGLQLVAALALASRLDLYVGVGGTWFSDLQIRGVEYERFRGHGFAAFEWRPWARWSLLVEVELSSRLATNIASYPAVQAYVNVAAKHDLSRRWQLELGFTENLEDQQSTTDFGAFLGLVARL